VGDHLTQRRDVGDALHAADSPDGFAGGTGAPCGAVDDGTGGTEGAVDEEAAAAGPGG
jgi:hypothetical protein